MLNVAMISVHTSPLARPGTADTGGMNTYVRELSRELGARGLRVDTFTRQQLSSEPPVVEQAENVRVIQVRAGSAEHLRKNQIYDALPEFAGNVEAYRLAAGLRYDLVHSHYWLSGSVGQRLARHWRVPHVSMFHTVAAAKHSNYPDDDSPQRWRAELEILESADVVVVASPHEKALMNHLSRESGARVVVIPCGVNLEHFRPMDKSAAKAKLGLSGKRVVLFVGRLVPLKGVDILVEATAKHSTVPNLQVVVVGGQGDGDVEGRRLRWLAEELNLDGRVRFEPAVDQSLLPVYYNAADVCVMPSHYESFGMVATEALACGTPVVASKVGGLPTIIRDRVNGLLVPWRCPQVFADRIAEVLTDETLRDSLQRQARQSVLHLSWSKIADEVLELYTSVLSEPIVKNSRQDRRLARNRRARNTVGRCPERTVSDNIGRTE